jgi:hypothetical protein
MNDAFTQALVDMLKLIDARFTAVEQRLTALEQRQHPEWYQQTHPRPCDILPPNWGAPIPGPSHPPGWGAADPLPQQPWVVTCDSRNSGGLNG